jgi:hypothetical protein
MARERSGPGPGLVRAVVAALVGLAAVIGFLLARSTETGLLTVAVLVPVLVVAIWTVRASRPPRRAPPAVVGPDWAGATRRFDRLRGEYAAYECDPTAVLRLPALADVTVPSTARFVDALAEAHALRTDQQPAEPVAGRFADAVEHAELAWRAAREAAERIGSSALSPAERAAVERVIALLTTARGSDSEPERVVAYARARAELRRLDRSGAVRVPLAAQATLDDGARGALPPAAS